MLYMIIFAIIGGVGTYVAAKVCNADFNGSYISTGGLMTFMGTALGAAVGFGIGVTRMANGNYLPEL